MELTYYGDKLSENMLVSPEGYLICQNAPIGRVGWMKYLAQELPAALDIPYGSVVKVSRYRKSGQKKVRKNGLN